MIYLVGNREARLNWIRDNSPTGSGGRWCEVPDINSARGRDVNADDRIVFLHGGSHDAFDYLCFVRRYAIA